MSSSLEYDPLAERVSFKSPKGRLLFPSVDPDEDAIDDVQIKGDCIQTGVRCGVPKGLCANCRDAHGLLDKRRKASRGLSFREPVLED